MPYSIAGKQKRQMALLRSQFAQKDGMPFADVLPAERVERALEEAKVDQRECVFTPLLTLWAFLSQVISADSSCRAAVARVLAWLVSQDERPCSADTSPYCKARKRLPEEFLRRLTRETAQTLHQQAPRQWDWKGRRVKLVDGTTVVMPDTKMNQEEFPQPPGQKKGLGFPIVRIAVVFSLACGSVLDAALGRYQGKRTGETSLLRSLEDSFERGDVLLGDRHFSGYCDIVYWQRRGVDVVARMNERRRCDMRRGTRLGKDDHVVVYAKPTIRPNWLTPKAFADIPAEICIREVRVRIQERGFRTREVVISTTLLDTEEYSADDLAQLYRVRWSAELDLRSLKIVMGMDMLRSRTPDMVRKEIWAHLLAYNLIRTVMAQAALTHARPIRAISFKGTVQTLQAFAVYLDSAGASDLSEQKLYAKLLKAIISHTVGNRPNRIEPRSQKRRPKGYPYLSQERGVAQKTLRAGRPLPKRARRTSRKSA
jgi:hypothetical protein